MVVEDVVTSKALKIASTVRRITSAAIRRRKAQPQVRHGQRDRDDGDDQTVAGELPERNVVPGAVGDPEDHDVGRRADGGGVAAEVGADGQGPPQLLRAVVAAGGGDEFVDYRAHRGHVRDVVDNRGQHGRDPEQQHRREPEPSTGRVDRRAGKGVDDAGVDQRAHHHEQAGEEHQGRSLHVRGHVGGVESGQREERQPAENGHHRRFQVQHGVHAEGDERRGQDRQADDYQSRVADGVALP
jgi:hypothetical protein